MPTTPARAALRLLALHCYRGQTHKRRTLLIGTTADDPAAGADGARVIRSKAEITPLGAKRNWLCDLAEDGWIVHWDDDDWSAPGRIETMIAAARNAGVEAAGLRTMWFDDGEHAWLYRGAQPYHVCGSSLVYTRRLWESLRFRAEHIGEDVDFARRAFLSGQLLALDDADLMVARDHGANTSPRMRQTAQWQSHDRACLPRLYLEDLQRCG